MKYGVSNHFLANNALRIAVQIVAASVQARSAILMWEAVVADTENVCLHHWVECSAFSMAGLNPNDRIGALSEVPFRVL